MCMGLGYTPKRKLSDRQQNALIRSVGKLSAAIKAFRDTWTEHKNYDAQLDKMRKEFPATPPSSNHLGFTYACSIHFKPKPQHLSWQTWIATQRVNIMTDLLNLNSKRVTAVPDLIAETKTNTMNKTRAKFTLTATKQEDGSMNIGGHAVTSGSEENKAFNDATPSGNFSLHIAAEKEAQNNFKEGTHDYFIDITPCDENAAAASN